MVFTEAWACYLAGVLVNENMEALQGGFSGCLCRVLFMCLQNMLYQVHCFNRDFISQSCNIISEFERVFAGPKVLNPGTNSMFIDAHRGKEEKGVRLEKHGHKSAIKHEIRAPPPDILVATRTP